MATTVILEVKAKAGTGNAVIETLRELLPDTRRYEGCLGLETLVDEDEPDAVLVIGKWESRGHYERYRAWRQETGAVDAFVDQLDGPPSIRYFDLADAYPD